jgi:ABC-2 type transport system ATP-binding protein
VRSRRSLLVAALLAIAWPATASAEDATITSFDGTPIVVHFFAAENPPPGGRAPTMLWGPGYSQGGDTNPNSSSSELFGNTAAGPLRRAGYNVLTWDPRGFGRSGGTVQVDSPEHEARDVQAIIDWLAERPEAQLDAPGDPRMGMQGASYGGAIQFATAQREPRIDAIVPIIAWHSLLTSLFKESTVKAGWGLVLCGAGEGMGISQGLFQPNPQTGGQDPVLTRTCANGVTTGTPPPPEDLAWFAARSRGEDLRRIRIPTFLVQGTVDTLFTLQEAMDNHAALSRNGIPLKMMWFCGGHGACTTGSGEAGHVERAIIAWLDRWVKRDRSKDTGPLFEWLADDARWRSAASFPLPRSGELAGTGSGTLALQPAASSGAAVAATPVPPGGAVEVETAPAAEDADLLGAPSLRLTYRGTAVPEATWIWAQVVDADRRQVAGNVVTPIPVVLDGEEHTIERPLEPIALRASKGARYRVQLIPSSTLYYPQRAAGAVEIVEAQAALPVVDAAAARAPGAGTRGSTASACRRGFRSVRLRPRGRALRITVRRRVPRRFLVEAFRSPRSASSIGRRVSRRRGRAVSSFRSPAGRRHMLRFTMRFPDGARDERRVIVRRAGGRWRVGAVRARCVRASKDRRPVDG